MPPEISDSIVYPDTGTSRIGKIQRIVLISGALATLVVGIMYVLDFKNQQGRGLASGTYLLLTSPVNPFTPAMRVDLKKKTATPASVEGIGTAVLTDVVGTEEKSIYLIANGALTETNIYNADAHNRKAGLSQRTFSHTVKSSLSYDAQSDSLTYVGAKGKEPGVVTVLAQGTTSEKTYGVGTNPTLLKGGFFLVYQKDDKLFSVNVQTKKEYPLISLPEQGSYVVDGEEMRVVVYDPQTRTLQYFSLAGMTSASFTTLKKEEGIGRRHRILGLSGDTLISAIQTEEGTQITMGDGKPVFIAGVTPHDHSRITIYHD